MDGGDDSWKPVTNGIVDDVTAANDNSIWEDYRQNIAKNVALERLRDATRKRHEGHLLEALDECEQAEVGHNDDITRAKYVLGVLKMQRDLMALCHDSDPARVKAEYDALRKNQTQYLDDTLWEQSQVRQWLWRLGDGAKYRGTYDQQVVSLTPGIISEIRRYTQPTKVVHSIVQAALLLLGENENLTKAWSYCQKCFNPQGAAGLVTRLIEFDLADVHCEIAARAEEMLNTLLGELKQGGGSEVTLRASSPSAFTLYVWTKAVIEQRKRLLEDSIDGDSEEPQESWKPARLRPLPSRQLEILEQQRKTKKMEKQLKQLRQENDAVAAAASGTSTTNSTAPTSPKIQPRRGYSLLSKPANCAITGTASAENKSPTSNKKAIRQREPSKQNFDLFFMV